MNNKLRLSLGLALIFGVAGCARTPVPDIGQADVPAAWDGPVSTEAVVWPEIAWWNNFGSAELTEFIEEVQANNFDFQTNIRNLRSAELSLRQAGFDLWPTPNVSISTGASTSNSTLIGGGSQGGGQTQGFNLSASASMGNILSKPLNYEQALNNYTSSQAQISSAALGTMTTAARTYFQLLGQRDQRVVTESNLETARQTLRFTQAEVNAGTAVRINLLNANIRVQQLENQLLQSYQSEYQTLASLALLVGRGVEGFDLEGQTLDGITVPEVQPGLPSELLTRRPDLVQAEIGLRNSAISVDSARLAFLPSISLNGSANSSSPALIDILSDPATTTVQLSSSLALTLLDNGTRKRNVERARINLENSLANYRTIIIRAFNDINTQLRNIELIKAQGAVNIQQLDQATEQNRLAQVRYEAGTSTYQEVLNAQDQLFAARQAVLSNRQNQLNAILELYTALGGGWEIGTVLLNDPAYAAAN
jgi:NodT family efflux transporter outer membrane factor (OMF) lipoprotein